MKKLLILASILIASSSFASDLQPVKEPLVQIEAYCGGSLRYRGKVSANDLNFFIKNNEKTYHNDSYATV